MGIKSLSKLLKLHCQQAFFLLPLEDLRGKRVAIDINLWMCANIRVSRQQILNNTNLELEVLDENIVMKHWLHTFCSFVIVWLRHGITPIFVFDGLSNEDKKAVREDRGQKQKKREEKVAEMMKDLEKDIFSRPANFIENLKKEIANCHNPGNDHYLALKQLIKLCGLPMLEAKTDAEKLCTSLALENYVAAVYSRDSDNLTFGCPLLLREFIYQGAKVYVDSIRLDLVLTGLQVSMAQFVDLCILCGCDFGGHIPNCGPIRAYDMIYKHHNIDLMPEKYQVPELNHKRCREIFAYCPSRELVTNKWCIDIDEPEENGKYMFCEKYHLHFRLQEIIAFYDDLPAMNGNLSQGSIACYGIFNDQRFNNKDSDYLVFCNTIIH